MNHRLAVCSRRRSRLWYCGTLVAAILLFATARNNATPLPLPPDSAATPSPLLDAMKAELDRSMKTFGAQDPAAYYIGYTLTDSQRATVSGSNGALLSSDEVRNRWLEVAVRTGNYSLDSTHKVDGRQPPTAGPGTNAPLDDDPDVLRRAIWLETDKQYRAAAEALIKIKTGKEVKVQNRGRKRTGFLERESAKIHRDVGFVHTGPETLGAESPATIRIIFANHPR